MTNCPNDSLDCLLRAILSAQSGYNWNPPTFGATVAIGVLALAVAITTVFQGALSAGPGRLKASQRAIGPVYYMKTRTRFSWIELRFRTIARVPFIDTIKWFDRLGAVEQDAPRHFKTYPSYGAGWLNLTNSIPLNCHHWETTHCQTDYLPSDIQAAPARATIRAIVELAVVTACDSVMLVKELPLARGNGSQLEFRDHPYLGIVAVFDQYLIEDRRPRRDVRKCHILYLDGQFSFQDIFMQALLFDGKYSSKLGLWSMSVMETVHRLASPLGDLAPHELHSVEAGLNPGTLKSVSLGLMTWDSPDKCHGLPYSKLRIRPSLLQLCQTTPCWIRRAKEEIINSIYALLQHRLNFLVYDKHRTLPRVLNEGLRQPKLGWTWLSSAVTRYPNSVEPGDLRHDPPADQGPRCPFEHKHGQRFLQGEYLWFDWRHGGPSDDPVAIMSDDGNLGLLPYALELCLDWLAQEDRFEGMTSDEKVNARAAIEHQLHEVDYWLLHQGSYESAAQIFAILMDFIEPTPNAVPLSPAKNPPPASRCLTCRTSSPRRGRARKTKKSRTFSFERKPPPSMQQRRADPEERASPFDSSRNLHHRGTEHQPEEGSRRSKPVHTRRPFEEGIEDQARRNPVWQVFGRFENEFHSKKGEHGYVDYPIQQMPPGRDITELLEVSRGLLDTTNELPSIASLDQMLYKGNYFCEIDQCNSAFNMAYELRDHCLEQHGYPEVNWGSSSPYARDHDERLVCALEWDVSANGHLRGCMRRHQEADQIFQAIVESMERATRPVMNFQNRLEDAQWSCLTDFEQRKRKILDTYELPPPLPQQSPTHHSYIIRIFEIQKHTTFWAIDRQWPVILEKMEHHLQENLDRHSGEVSQDLETQGLSFRQERNDQDEPRDLAHRHRVLTVWTPANQNDDDGNLSSHHVRGKEEGPRARRIDSEQRRSLQAEVSGEEDAEDGLKSRSRQNPEAVILSRAADIAQRSDSSGERVPSWNVSDHEAAATIKSWADQGETPHVAPSLTHSPIAESGEPSGQQRRPNFRNSRGKAIDRQLSGQVSAVAPSTEQESATIGKDNQGNSRSSEAAREGAIGMSRERGLIVHPSRERPRQSSPIVYDGDSESSRDERMVTVRSDRGRRSRSSSSDNSPSGPRLVPERLRLLAPGDGLSSTSSQIIRGKGSAADKGMRTLLLYRAVLFAALCALAADTSCVYETELGRRVVQVL